MLQFCWIYRTESLRFLLCLSSCLPRLLPQAKMMYLALLLFFSLLRFPPFTTIITTVLLLLSCYFSQLVHYQDIQKCHVVFSSVAKLHLYRHLLSLPNQQDFFHTCASFSKENYNKWKHLSYFIIIFHLHTKKATKTSCFGSSPPTCLTNPRGAIYTKLHYISPSPISQN